jgi:hypothetical protein
LIIKIFLKAYLTAYFNTFCCYPQGVRGTLLLLSLVLVLLLLLTLALALAALSVVVVVVFPARYLALVGTVRRAAPIVNTSISSSAADSWATAEVVAGGVPEGFLVGVPSVPTSAAAPAPSAPCATSASATASASALGVPGFADRRFADVSMLWSVATIEETEAAEVAVSGVVAGASEVTVAAANSAAASSSSTSAAPALPISATVAAVGAIVVTVVVAVVVSVVAVVVVAVGTEVGRVGANGTGIGGGGVTLLLGIWVAPAVLLWYGTNK